ncbi:MAG TPA: site-specific integrase [Actinomycetota bacterium]|nr:site-specific integrase [Actinomycetota bacterium]
MQHAREDRLAPLFFLAATSGMRRSELLGLAWRDISLDAEPPRLQVRRVLVQYGKITAIKEPKTARSRRTIALDPAATAALKTHKARLAEERLRAGAAYEEGGWAFPDELGRLLSPSSVSAAFRRRVKAAGLPPIGLHGLRHSFATMGLEAGVDTLYISEILGHSSPAITMSVYQHTREERLGQAVRQVGDAIFGAAR